ncbi:hypothetical protein H0H93_016639 [Arthromyces matolae]|nr:hypothetical protein H0H93_016639 [Arthromyces matolae]
MATPSSSRPPLRQYKRDFETAQLDSIQSSAKRTQAAIAQGGLERQVIQSRPLEPGVRILQLADNPESRWAEMRQAALDRLKSENEALLKRLRELGSTTLASTSSLQALGEQEQPSLPPPRQMEGMGETTTTTADLVPRASWELLNREKMDLQEELTQKDKRLQRLKEVYNAKGAEFRDAIASILGVKLSFRPNGEVRATSIYDLGASFAFQPAKGTMQLVAQGEGGPQDLPSMMKYWIGGEQCIPGFMASVTLECYEYAKRKGGQGQGGD